ncbi:MAG TPA: 50S ribosomal protein L14 [Thermoplasmatales archaeon]|nr:50S ribosomal protein L14 [Candidatus Thermoplasmatota archaeon]MDD5778095.1 50S ribosomal protein L14 [Candidatus Thermoplasmatota archaeon]HDS59349.1 50S ribosomal protein L14 [Thermoplasmatales archaeon]
MKGIAAKVTRGLITGTRLDCVDNTGARVVEIVAVKHIKTTHRQYPSAGVGDLIVVTVKKGKPEMKRQLFHAVVVRQRMPYNRPDGMKVQFEDNAAVIVTPEGDLKGSVIKGPVAREAAERWPRVSATASMIV